MIFVRLPVVVLTAFLLVATTGCNDGVSPGDLGDLDPLALANAVDALVAPLQSSSEAGANLSAAVADLNDAGVVWRAFESPFLQRARTRPALQGPAHGGAYSLPRTPLFVTFPPEVEGQTFVLNFEEQRWESDDLRNGAPSDGVRVVWYSVDGSGRVRFPLDERGYIDLRPGPGAGDAMLVRMVETGEDGALTLLDFVQNRDVSGEDVEVEWFTAEGYYSDLNASTRFDIESEETLEVATGDLTYDLVITLEDETTRYTMDVKGEEDGDSGEYNDRITATAVRGGATTVLEVSFRGTGTSREEAGGTIVRNGTLLANIDINGDSFDFSTPDGGSFAENQSFALHTLFSAMTRSGFQVLLNLPLVRP